MGYLEGKSIAVTGAGRGIGRAVALACAAEGASVVVNDYGVAPDGSEPTSEIADGVVEEIRAAGGKAVSVADDVTKMTSGERIVEAAISEFGGLDGVVAVAAILRERMFFNMVEDEWDPVIAVHLKGTFSVFRAAAQHFKQQQSGAYVSFTSGAFAGSVAQANYSAAKGGIVSLSRSVAVGMYRYNVISNVIAPVAKTRLSAEVPGELEMGEAEDVAPMVVYLLGDHARENKVTGQIYTANAGKVAVWNQPSETRAMFKDGRWTPEEIQKRLLATVGQEKMGMIDRLATMKAAADSGAKPNK